MRMSSGVISGDILLKVPNDRFRVRQCVDHCDATEGRDQGEDRSLWATRVNRDEE